jgi:hypothetical protein
MFMIICFQKNLFFCGKGDSSNLNIDICKIQLAMNYGRQVMAKAHIAFGKVS